MLKDPHIARAFDRDLEAVQAMIMRMGGLVEAALSDAATALETQDNELAEKVRLGDKAIDALEDQVNAECARVIALRAPCSCNISPKRARHRVMHRCGHEQALGLSIASGPQCKHAFAVQSGRFGRWCALVHMANACHLPLETARSMRL